MQPHVDNIIEKAKKEADKKIAQANKNADKVMDDVITKSKHESDIIIHDITQKYRQETEAKSFQTIASAQEKAG